MLMFLRYLFAGRPMNAPEPLYLVAPFFSGEEA